MLNQDTRVLNALERAGIVLAYSALALALITLVAWAGRITILLFPIEGASAMKPLPAICTGLISVALLMRVQSGRMANQLVAIFFAALGSLLPLVSALQYVTGVDYGIDRLLFPAAIHLDPVTYPGRFAPSSSIVFAMLGLAVITLDMQLRRVRVADILGIVSGVISLVAIAGYLYQADASGAIPGFFNVIAPAVALCFAMLAAAVLIVRPSQGLASLLAARSFGSLVLRRLIPVTLVFPLMLGLLRSFGQELGLWDPAYGSALNTGFSTLLFTSLVWWAAVQLHQLDVARDTQAEQLRQSEERSRNILETANEGIWILDLGARTSYVNKRLQEMLGYTASEMLGRPLYDFVSGGHAAEAEEHFSSRIEGSVESYDFQFRRKDGTTLWAIVNSTPLKDKEGRFDGVLKMVSDITERKEAEEELRLSEEALQRAQRVAHIGSWEWDVPSDRVIWSDELYRIYGLNPDEFGASFEAFNTRLHPDDREFVQRTIGKAFEEASRFHFEHRIVRPDGEVRYLDARGECIAGPDGGTVLLRGTGQDITERKQAELALHEAQEHFQSVLDNAGMSIAVKDLRGRYVIANTETAEALGAPAAAELIGKRDDEFVPAEVAERIRATDLESMQSESSVSVEQDLPAQNGQLRSFWTTKFPMRDAHGTVVGVGVISQEITELRQAEKALRESESRNRSILEAALDAVVSINEAGKITSWNKQAEELFGWNTHEAVGRPITIIIPDRYRDAHNEGMSRFRVTGDAPVVGKVLQVEARHRDGREFPVDLAIGKGTSTSGEVSFSAFIRDISDRRRAEKEVRDKSLQLEELNSEMQVALQELANSHQLLQDQAAALERSNADLDDFAYIASHDLKEPLRGISNYAHFLHEDYSDKLDESGREMLATLPRLTKRLETLLDALLKYSRLNRAEVVPLATDLDSVITDVKEMLEARLREGNVEIRTPRPLPTIMCDRSQTTEIFLNLISNAIKYNDEPLKLVEVGYIEESELEPELNGSNGANGRAHPNLPSQRALIFYVSDNGIGIPEKYLETVFGAFRRLHNRDKYGGGTGVGLAIVKKMVERQGGRIWVESEPGQGSTFYFTLNPEVVPAGGVGESRTQ